MRQARSVTVAGCVVAVLSFAAPVDAAEPDCYPRKATTVVDTAAVHLYERLYDDPYGDPNPVTYACLHASRQRYRLGWGDEFFNRSTGVSMAGRFAVYAAGDEFRIRDLVTGEALILAEADDTFLSAISSMALSRRGAVAWLQTNYWAQPNPNDYTRIFRLDDRGPSLLVDCNSRTDTCVDPYTLTMSEDERRIYWREFFGDHAPSSADVQTAAPAPTAPPAVRSDGSGGPCRPRGSRTLIGNAEAHVFRLRGRIWGCYEGDMHQLARVRRKRGLAANPVLAGHFVAFRKYRHAEQTVQLRVLDLAAGRVVRKVGRVRADAHRIGPYVLNDSGSVAWATQALRGDRTVQIHASDDGGRRLLDRSTGSAGHLIDPRSLAIGDAYGAFGSYVYWYRARQNGAGEPQLAEISARRWG
jgi:hypothetical protein